MLSLLKKKKNKIIGNKIVPRYVDKNNILSLNKNSTSYYELLSKEELILILLNLIDDNELFKNMIKYYKIEIDKLENDTK
jgi:hypothetical protein